MATSKVDSRLGESIQRSHPCRGLRADSLCLIEFASNPAPGSVTVKQKTFVRHRQDERSKKSQVEVCLRECAEFAVRRVARLPSNWRSLVPRASCSAPLPVQIDLSTGRTTRDPLRRLLSSADSESVELVRQCRRLSRRPTVDG